MNSNLFVSSEPRDFWVWIDPSNWLVKNNAGLVGTFSGGPIFGDEPSPANLPFVLNPEHKTKTVTPFHAGIIQHYRIEYDLERFRHLRCKQYPSRFYALFLLPNRAEGLKYRDAHPKHTADRTLKRVRTEGRHMYSTHDAAWIDFLLMSHMIDEDSLNFIWRKYWTGESREGHTLLSHGKSWTGTSATEVLFYGHVRFANKNLSEEDL